VVIDIGARFAGYHSDLTRTVFVGKPSPRQIKVYRAVCKAQSEVLKRLFPGLKGWEVDAMARKVLSEEGFDAYFIHSLGHGVGVDVHEAPRLSARSQDVLQHGNVVTVEPGVYLPRSFGVRIEDLVAVTRSGPRLLTESQKRVY
jgi:Xaa-Pro aminopeptidase